MLTIGLLGAWAALCLLQLARFALASRYLRVGPPPDGLPAGGPQLVLLVPVLSEQDVIENSLQWFGGLTATLPWLSVVYVTTEREPRAEGRPSTRAMIERRLPQLARVSVLHYPYRYGVMAHQLNYAIDQLFESGGNDRLIGVYNVDSKPGAAAIVAARAALLADPRSVVQQYAIYPFPPPDDFAAAVLSHIACWQTRWSLHFELARTLIAQVLPFGRSVLGRAATLTRPILYAIGHGLFLRAGCWRELSGFPEDEINEDAFFGLQLRLAGYRMQSVPFLEPALPPPALRVYLRQQAVWYNGPARAWHYWRKLTRGGAGRHRLRPQLTGWTAAWAALETFKLWLAAFYWLLGPWLIALVIPALALAQGLPLALLPWLALLLWWCWGFHRLVHGVYRTQGIDIAPPGDVAASVVAYLLHGVGPIIWLARSCSGRNGQARKYKTERSGSADAGDAGGARLHIAKCRRFRWTIGAALVLRPIALRRRFTPPRRPVR
jgi:hypothetical protein